MSEEGREIQTGDVVVLKSGGPFMTVEVGPSTQTRVHCVWFAGSVVKGASFPVGMVRHAEKEPE